MLLLILLIFSLLLGQSTPQEKPNTTPPRVLHPVEPVYTADARLAGIEGTVVLELVVSDKGRAKDITVLNPIGFGLDESAAKALAKWKFQPATEGGKPVEASASVEVSFKVIQNGGPNPTPGQVRTWFNSAFYVLQHGDQISVDKAVQTILDLSRQKFPPAMYVVAGWNSNGEHGLTKSPSEGWALMQKSAAMKHGPALYEVAMGRIEGRGIALDATKGMEEMRAAASLGSDNAQLFLAQRYETEKDLDNAGRNYRLCAVSGVAICQFRLASILLANPDRADRDRVQAVAWLELAAERGVAEAREIAAREALKLTDAQRGQIPGLKKKLIRT